MSRTEDYKWKAEEIVDCHHHLWDLENNCYPWLSDRITQRVCGDYAAIRRNYLLDSFLEDIGSVPVKQTVHVQAEFDHKNPVEESAWLDRVSNQSPQGFPTAVVAYADFSDDEIGKTLERHCEYGRVRGIRQMLHEYVVDPDAGHPAYIVDPKWLENFRIIESFSLSFDLQVYPTQADPACQLIARHPGVGFVLCHMGQPAREDDEGISLWKAALKRYAQFDNVSIKISGIGMFRPNWSFECLESLVSQIVEIFGTERVLLGSNFPVDGMAASYFAIWSAYDKIFSAYSEHERAQVFAANARRVYRI